MKTLLITLIASTLFVAKIATAQSSNSTGLFVEPSVSFEKGESSVKYPGLSNSTGTTDGFGLGARLGFHLSEVFFAGVDGRYAMVQYKDSSVNSDSKSNSYNVGPVVGMQMPVLGLRLWGAYVMDGELNPAESQGFDVKFNHPTGPRIGAAFHLAAMSLDVEYQQLKYGSSTLERVGNFSANTRFDDVHLENNSWIVSLSFPLAM